MKSTFNRDYEKTLNLCKTRNDFINAFMRDVEKGKAFIAFRPMKKITVYYLGSQMCVLDPINKFSPKVESKYLPILKSDKSSNGDFTEEEWKEKTGVKDYTWKDIYPEIRDNLSYSSGPEDIQVSDLYKYSPLAYRGNSNVILLDIEAKFSYSKKNGISGNNLRIDVILFNVLTRQLAFVEVKRLSDDRLQINGEVQEKIVEQLKAYNTLIKNEHDEIIREYNKTIQAYSDLYGLSFPTIDGRKSILLGLLITEYSEKDKEIIASLSEQIKNHNDLAGISVLTVGNVNNVKAETLENKWFPSMINS